MTHDHSHHHHDHHPEAPTPRLPLSLLLVSAPARLGGAAVLIALVWAATLWALR